MSKPDDSDEPFLSRWSRRKRETARDLPVPDGAETQTAALDPGAAPGKTADAEPELDLSTLPRVDELTESSDITAFLDKRVPALLRNAALGRMWTLDPTIRDFIEVAENQWNWNVPGGAPFYCEIEAGSGAGELVADAADAISRAGAVPPSLAVAEPGLPAAATNQHSQKVEETVARAEPSPHGQPPGDAAVQEECTPDDAAQPPIAADSVAIAAAHTWTTDEPAESGPHRRRHGGALPV